MRRVASLFTSKRSDKSDQPSTRRKTHLFRSTSRLNVSGQSSRNTEQGNSTSSSSSTGSNGLRTPPDDDTHTVRSAAKMHWPSWLGGAKTAPPRRTDTSQSLELEGPKPWQVRNPHRGAEEDSEEDTSSEEDDDDSELAENKRIATPAALARSRTNLRNSTSNSLISGLSSPPFLTLSDHCIFPRSCSPLHILPPRQTIHSAMHRRRLLLRLDQAKLSHSEELSILPLSARLPQAVKHLSTPMDRIDASALGPCAQQVTMYSPGLKRWARRRCFEDRMAVWLPDEIGQNIVCRGVFGTTFGVAEIELSEGIEALAGLVYETSVPEPPVSAPSSNPSQASSAVQNRNAPYKTVPSPLREQHSPPMLPSLVSTLPSPPPEASIKPEEIPILPNPHPKRGVRFAEDDKDEQIPLGYVLRIKKRREEKAKFLREERERRLFEEEKVRAEEERRKREAERQAWELERKAWEKERKAMEEERKKRLYAQEVTAARQRRENQRTGLVPSSSSTSLKDSSHLKVPDLTNYSRPVYDLTEFPWRQASDATTSAGSSPHTGSPGSSRPPSLVHGTSGSNRSSIVPSRPPSIYTQSSSEELRIRTRSGSGSRNGSVASESQSKRPSSDRTKSLPAQPMMGQIPAYPYPYPYMPAFPVDMPLLPPSPPFMTQQYGYRPRPNSYNSAISGGIPSSSSSPRRQSHGLPTSQSSDRVSSSSSKNHYSSRHSYQRESSGERSGSGSARSSNGNVRGQLEHRSSSHLSFSSSRSRQPPPSAPRAVALNPMPISSTARGRTMPHKRSAIIT